MKCLAINFFCMKFFTTPNSKSVIATLHIVTIEKSKLTFLLILYFHGPGTLISDRETRALVAAKEAQIQRSTVANTASTPDTETKVEGMEIDNEF